MAVSGETIFRRTVRGVATLPILTTGAVLIMLVVGAFPIFREQGLFTFLTGSQWAPNKDIYGVLPALTGSVTTAFIALLFAIPLGLGIALFIDQLCPPRFKTSLTLMIDTLAAIPSIIYGLWGILVLAPFASEYIQPFLGVTLGRIPVIGLLFEVKTPGGINTFTASLVLAFMITPFISSLARESFALTEKEVKEAAYGLGATSWEVIRDVIIPFAKQGLLSGILLALSRALGETMAVAYLIGNSVRMESSLFDPSTTVSALIANEFAESDGLHQSALITLALVLLILNFVIFALAKYFVRRGRVK